MSWLVCIKYCMNTVYTVLEETFLQLLLGQMEKNGTSVSWNTIIHLQTSVFQSDCLKMQSFWKILILYSLKIFFFSAQSTLAANSVAMSNVGPRALVTPGQSFYPGMFLLLLVFMRRLAVYICKSNPSSFFWYFKK